MSEKNSKALVPLKKDLPPAIRRVQDVAKPFELVNGNLKLQSREDVRNLLPDILGKVLARVWLDPTFHREFSQDPQKTLEGNGVFLPENMSIEFQKPNSDRPKIIVYEKKQNSHFKIRVVQLQLVMLAGR